MSAKKLTPAECDPHDIGKDGKAWWYVGKRACTFVVEHDGGSGVVDIQVTTIQIRRALFAMDMQLGKQRAATERRRAMRANERRS
jgi:hypothetical protein